MENLEEIEDFIKKNKRNPTSNSEEDHERKLAYKMYKLKKIEKIMDNGSLRKSIDKIIVFDTLSRKIDDYINFSRKIDRRPSLGSLQEEELKYATFYRNQKRTLRKRELPQSTKDKLYKMFHLEF